MNWIKYCLLASFWSITAYAQRITDIRVEGNAKVESEAILNTVSSRKGEEINRLTIANDIRELYKLGYFSDIRFLSVDSGDGFILKIKVVEKPAIINIRFEGMNEVKEDDFKDTLETKLYTIVNEGTIASDVRLIEKKYSEKGFYLAKVDYTIEDKSANEVEVVFKVNERGKVLVGDVFILGNEYFSDSDIIDKLATRPYTRSGAYGSGSLFQKDYVNRDLEFLAYYYKDYGFANVRVAQPVIQMDTDQNFVRVTFQVDEGLQYNIGTLHVSGDLEGLYQENELLEAMLLKETELFRYSRFAKDVEMLVDKYGDLGYAYVDVNPKTTFNDEARTVDINYEITKGQKVYFGEMLIVGNTKTRDNVIRREFEVTDAELYSGTRLSLTKRNVNRLGFFEEVQVIKERDEQEEDVVNLKLKVKEKPTGQLQASIGFSPQTQRKQSWFGQGRYDESNQSGKAWHTSLSARWATTDDYDLELGFTDPKVYDSDWSLGTYLSHSRFERRYAAGIEIPETKSSVSVTVGRKIIELIRGSLTLRYSKIRQLREVYIFEGYVAGGVQKSVTLGISRKDVDNYLDPSQGSIVSLSHNFSGGPLKGDYQYQESQVDSAVYLPLDYTEEFRTYFKLRGVLGKLWQFQGQELPPSERYRLGGFDSLRGYPYWSVGPTQRRMRSPRNAYYDYELGGDKQVYFQFEYFVPLIPKAGIKSLVFADAGRVYKEDESISFGEFKKDVGFGFRWLTPLAPFRFEWAYPYDDEKKRLGELQFIFTLGY
ncbi:MAG: outer membrane protein assembly factor BamA [Deltaproteobacteria bacterium]|nr:outer membrane protein assembly factor BamA [Deltaproteobacteria bacterium]